MMRTTIPNCTVSSQVLRESGFWLRAVVFLCATGPFAAWMPAHSMAQEEKPDSPFSSGEDSNEPTKGQTLDDRTIQQRTEQLERHLAQRMSVDFREVPLDQFVAYLKETYRVPVIINQLALEVAAIEAESSAVSFACDSIRGDTMLGAVLRDLSLVYEIHDGMIELTTKEDAEAHPRCRIYQCEDLIHNVAPAVVVPKSAESASDSTKEGTQEENVYPCELMKVIVANIEPNSWEQNGGIGVISLFDGKSLVVTNTYDVQRKIETLLANLRQVESSGEGAIAGD